MSLRAPEQFLVDTYPDIDWEEPQNCGGLGGESYGLACRFCIAIWGMTGEETQDKFADQPHLLTHVTKLPRELPVFRRHMRVVHHRLP